MTRELTGTLVKVKEDSKNLVYEVRTDRPGLTGTIYVDKAHLPLFDDLFLLKAEEGSAAPLTDYIS
jgi:hypothetical protein